jgi:signal transduction histidine kinase/pSer/pThr/pTyr-binding forkhead associated (FHA) protein
MSSHFYAEGGSVSRLILIKGADEGRQFELTQAVHSVGRDSSSSIRLHDTEVSRRHAEFRLVNGAFCLVDVGSANGTFVNGQRIQDARFLEPGDRIQIGQTILVYSAGPTEAQENSDLADRIDVISRHDMELSSAIIKTIAESEGSRLLAQPEQVKGPWLKSALANLGIMYETIQAVSHILDLDQLLERIMDLIFRSIEADRGCIMLRNPETGQFEPKAVRWRQGSTPQEKMTVSRTVMDYVLREKEGVLVFDAAHDKRFSTGHSIVRFGIHEVICVPMKGRHETLGVLYLDTLTATRGLMGQSNVARVFTEDHLALAIAIGHQAALAVEETRYHHAMVQAERLAAIGQTIAALSHHIKNILQGLRSGSEILKMGLTAKDENLLEKGWKIVEKNQAKIYNLVMDMLSYSKEREPAVEDTDLNNVVADVLELVEGRIKELGVQVETRLGNLPLAPVDPEGFHRALLNIISNALDALEEQPNPCVSVATRLEATGAWLSVQVQDNGVGISQERLRDIFKPFVSTKGARGTGLGLAVSRKIIREHGGDIFVHSQPGKGSRFTLRLPVKSPFSPDLNSPTGELPVLEPPEPD